MIVALRRLLQPVRHALWLIGLTALLVAPGCNQSGYELAPVRGTVTVDGKPLRQGKVMFAPVAQGNDINPGRPAFGMLRQGGAYILTTYADNDGAVVGKHWVTIINSAEDLPRGVPEFARVTAPGQRVVEAGKDNRIDINLTREDVLKYRMDDK
jgi:hypothetical protein